MLNTTYYSTENTRTTYTYTIFLFIHKSYKLAYYVHLRYNTIYYIYTYHVSLEGQGRIFVHEPDKSVAGEGRKKGHISVWITINRLGRVQVYIHDIVLRVYIDSPYTGS